jgi:SulP family sulfate permease
MFANANDFKNRALEAIDDQPEPVEWLLLNAEAIVNIDVTAADQLAELYEELRRRGIELAFARIKQDLRRELAPTGLLEEMGEDHLFPTLPVAIEAFKGRDQGSPKSP